MASGRLITAAGYEVKKNNILLTIKMHFHTFLICLAASLVLAIAVTILMSGHMDKYVMEKFIEAEALSHMPGDHTVSWNKVDFPPAILEYDIWNQYKFTVMKPGIFFVLITTGVYILGYPLLIGWFLGTARKLEKAVVLRGTKIEALKVVRKQMKKSGLKGDIPMGRLFLPHEFEVYHTLVLASIGWGKSTWLFQALAAKIGKSKMIVYDKDGELVEAFYNSEAGDLIFNPFDSRCVGWNIFNEINTPMDIEAIAASLIPYSKSGGQQEFFLPAAKDLFIAGLHYLWQTGRRTNTDVWHFFSSPVKEIRNSLEGIKGAERGFAMIEDASSKQALGVKATLLQYIGAFEYMTAMTGTFSLAAWLMDGKPNKLFLTNYEDTKDTLKPILSLFVDRLGKKMLSALPDRQRRVFFFLDELGSLQRLPILKDLVTQGRKRGVAVIAGIQDIAQLDSIYGREMRQTLLNSLSTVIAGRCVDGPTAEYIAHDRIGKQEVREPHVNQSWGLGQNRDGGSTGETTREKYAVLPAEIMQLKNMEAYIQIMGFPPVRDYIRPIRYQPKSPAFILRSGLSLEEIQASQAALQKNIEDMGGEGFDMLGTREPKRPKGPEVQDSEAEQVPEIDDQEEQNNYL